jgi:hypothetical protein
MKEEQKKTYVVPVMEEVEFSYKENLLLSGSSEDPEEESDPEGALFFD